MTDSAQTSTRSPQQHDILIVTGMSGAGRSTVGKALEDLGWYVVDNLPTQMLGPLTSSPTERGRRSRRSRPSSDVRGGRFFTDPEQAVEQVRSTTSARVRVLFSRRPSGPRAPLRAGPPSAPQQEDGTLLDGIGRERALGWPGSERRPTS